ncbi:MAG: hypothetical protein Q8O67_29090 [Deltaproteobacteria bacterium]|nr:hypothetical protein [Deltaproteobacteria bacterium]
MHVGLVCFCCLITSCAGRLSHPDVTLDLEKVEDDGVMFRVASVRGEGEVWSFPEAVVDDVTPHALVVTAADRVAWRLSFNVMAAGDEDLTPTLPVAVGDRVDLTVTGTLEGQAVAVVESSGGGLRFALSRYGINSQALHGQVGVAFSDDVFCPNRLPAPCRLAKGVHTVCGDNELALVFTRAGERVELPTGERGRLAGGTLEAWNIAGSLTRLCGEDERFHVGGAWSVIAVD